MIDSMYFNCFSGLKKALVESESEWAQNKQLIRLTHQQSVRAAVILSLILIPLLEMLLLLYERPNLERLDLYMLKSGSIITF